MGVGAMEEDYGFDDLHKAGVAGQAGSASAVQPPPAIARHGSFGDARDTPVSSLGEESVVRA
jgi:hypothetical protein